MHAAIAGGGDLSSKVKTLRGLIGKLTPAIEKHDFTAQDLNGMLASLIDDGLAGEYSDYQGAEQAAMGLQAVADFMSRRKLAAAAALRPGMQRVMAAVKDDEAYRAEEFAAALQQLRAGIDQARALPLRGKSE